MGRNRFFTKIRIGLQLVSFEENLIIGMIRIRTT